jgi:hypothetical protein
VTSHSQEECTEDTKTRIVNLLRKRADERIGPKISGFVCHLIYPESADQSK